MKQRLASSAVIISLFVGILYLDIHHPLLGTGGLWLLPLVLVLALLATSELVDMFTRGGMLTRKRHVMFSVALVHLLTFIPILMDAFGGGYPDNCPVSRLGWAPMGAVLALCWLWVVEMRHYSEAGGVIQRLANSSLIILYTGVAMSFLTILRTLDAQTTQNGPWGMVALLSIVIVTKVADSGAYFVGRSIGRHKMAPRLSPGKTIEGACGAMLAGTLTAVCIGKWFAPYLAQILLGSSMKPEAGPLWAWAIYGFMVTLTGMFGDLAESLIKRDMQQKDSSHWLPGLGGVLDIMDSITLSLVPAYLFWITGLIGSC
ncbi:MAG: phosphatidate cytidylyltransferase [Planctomycetota bacterium]|nr:phosphatidate cytidylyltransferase [Planctomycetota bacterium]